MTVNHRGPGRFSGLPGLLLALSLFFPASIFANQPQTQPGGIVSLAKAKPLPDRVVQDSLGYVPGQLLVKLKDSVSVRVDSGKLVAGSPDLANMLSCFQLSVADQVSPGILKLAVPPGSSLDVAEAAKELEATGAVSYAGPNHLFYAMTSPNDPEYVAGQQWGLTQIKAEQAWDVTTGANDIVIAILDTGTALDHPDLSGKIVGGYNFVANNNNPYDDEGHGTYTAGIAAATSNNSTGVAGVSWGARIMPVKVLNARGQGSEDVISQGIRWAVDHGARIISASLGGDQDTPVMQDAVKYAADHNVLLVASAGNTPDGKPNYPAGYDSVLAVGATGRNDTYTGFSSYGDDVDVTAPGVGILSTSWDSGNLTYSYANGTSASCPFVSGVAALVMSVNPSLTAEQVRWIIEESSDDLGPQGWDEHYGDGRLDAYNAVTMAQKGPPTPPTPRPKSQVTPGPGATRVPNQQPTLQLDTTKVAPGALVAIIAAGFGSNEIVNLDILTTDGNVRGVGSAQTDSQGTFRAEIALPKDLAPGSAALTAIGATSRLRASASLTVLPGAGGNGGQSSVKGTVHGVDPGQVQVRLKPSLGVSGPDQTAQPDGSGMYLFSGLSSGIYALSASAPGYLPAGPFTLQVDGTAGDIKTVDITLATTRPTAFDKVAAVDNSPTLVYFSPVGHTLSGPFLKYWQSHGGLAIFGYPISEPFQEVSPTDGKPYTVQYFERNRFEYHPENQPPNDVLMGLLGVQMTAGRAFQPGAPFQSDQSRVYFQETQHSLSGPFLKYWQSHGGLAIFGYPISEELMENGYLVQYFQRNRFELHPEFAGTPNEVELGLLGVEVARLYGWISP